LNSGRMNTGVGEEKEGGTLELVRRGWRNNGVREKRKEEHWT
jgi:hypothetical protein